MTLLRTAVTAELTAGELAALRRMVFEAFGGRFDEHDWEHTLGGIHVLVVDGGEPVAHGAVVPRVLVAGGHEVHTGYVEGVATRADRRGHGLATAVMREVGRVIRDGHELGALSDGTRIPGFYQRLGWEAWRGPTFVAGPEGPVRTEEDDGGILVLRTRATAGLELTGPLVGDWRAGDVW